MSNTHFTLCVVIQFDRLNLNTNVNEAGDSALNLSMFSDLPMPTELETTKKIYDVSENGTESSVLSQVIGHMVVDW